jgi:uncharacterized protein DUF6786
MGGRSGAGRAVVLGTMLIACRSSHAPVQSLASQDDGAGKGKDTQTMGFTNFADDVAFLSKHGALRVFEAPGGGRVAVSAKYQGRVMTSTVEPGGRSLGFVNRAFIEQGKVGTQFDNYGGEDRFWLGPEGGQFALYFPAGQSFVFSSWQTPHGMQEGEWDAKDESPTAVDFGKKMAITNYAGTTFEIEVDRRVSLLSAEEAAARLGTAPSKSVKWVGFATSNTIKNAGQKRWTADGGLPSIWILGMFAPVPGTQVVVPFEKTAGGEIVNDRYFGKVPADRLAIRENFLLFKCDGRYRSKIGLGPARAKPALGSYSDESKLLTVVLYTKSLGAKRYVNSMWEVQKDPYGGDVVNSYNDGPTEPGKPSLGGFYEIETSSPAADLPPGGTLTHVHQTYHFTGPREALDAIARTALGVGLAEIGGASGP